MLMQLSFKQDAVLVPSGRPVGHIVIGDGSSILARIGPILREYGETATQDLTNLLRRLGHPVIHIATLDEQPMLGERTLIIKEKEDPQESLEKFKEFLDNRGDTK